MGMLISTDNKECLVKKELIYVHLERAETMPVHGHNWSLAFSLIIVLHWIS
jgi:hypothetical protein